MLTLSVTQQAAMIYRPGMNLTVGTMEKVTILTLHWKEGIHILKCLLAVSLFQQVHI